MVYRLTLAYRGDAYAGWQRQENALAVQQVLEEALAAVLGRAVAVVGAGRTDAGVHARGQEAHLVRSGRPGGELSLRSLIHGTNHFLPGDVRVLRAFRMHPGFHARKSAIAKEYRYRWIAARVLSPLDAPFAAPLPAGADPERMAAAAERLMGRHDFSAFARAGGAHSQPFRRILGVRLRRSGAVLELRLTGDGFLRGMVRAIAGTLVQVGLGRRSPEEFAALLGGGPRSDAGPTAPACGLVMERVDYDPSAPPLAAEAAGPRNPFGDPVHEPPRGPSGPPTV